MLWYHSLRSPFWWVVSVAPGGKKAELCKKKSCLKNIFLYPCGQGTGVAPAWVSLHALLPGRPILIQYCAINTSTVQRGLYEILTVTIQMKATSTCNFWISSRNEVQKVDYKNVQFTLYQPFTIKYTEGNLFKIFAGLLSSFAVRASFNLKNSAN